MSPSTQSVTPLRLPDGAVVRSATREDIPTIGRVIQDRLGKDDRTDLELVSASPHGLSGIAVVERQGQPVATATLLDEQIRIGRATLPAGQVELVACAPDSEHRGYVRALMDWCHRTSAARANVVEVMIGIPNFYRQFGYEYAIPMHPWATITARVQGPSDVRVRPAEAADLPAMQGLQNRAQGSFDVAMPHQDECWNWLLQGSGSELWVAERDGAAAPHIDGVARLAADGDGGLALGELATVDSATTRALLADAQTKVGPKGAVRAANRPHVLGLDEQLGEPERQEWYYVRVADPVILFESLRSELSARVKSHELESGEALISFFRSQVRFTWDSAGVGEIRGGGPLQAPVSAGGSGIPYQALGELVFGCGAAGLEERFPDAHLGRQAEMMRVLFPARRADLLTFYLPS